MIDARRIDAEIDIGQHRAQQNNAIALLEIFAHAVGTHGAFVDAEISGIGFGKYRLAAEGRGDGNARRVREFDESALQLKAMDLQSGQDDGPRRRSDSFGRFGQRKAQHLGIAGLGREHASAPRLNRGGDHVARKLDIDGPAVLAGKIKRAIDLVRRGARIVEDGGRDRELGNYVPLAVEIPHFVVDQAVARALADAGRAADDHHRRTFRESLRQPH